MNKMIVLHIGKCLKYGNRFCKKAFNVSGNLLPDGYIVIEIVTIFMFMNNKNKFEVQITNSLL